MSAATKQSGRHIALLRGVNVGGKNPLSMKALAAMFENAGCREVSTYIQSGNVLFAAGDKVAAKISSQVAARIRSDLGITVPVIIRSAEALARVLENNPFLARGEARERLHVAFLADRPSAAAVKGLDAKRSAGDEFAVVGEEIYLFLPGGVGKSKLTNAYFDSKLKTVSSIRNWKTVETLVSMAT